MAAVMIPFQASMTAELHSRNLMIDYAYSTYQYVLTPSEVNEVMKESYWDDVDAFCSYMIAANFGQSVPGTKNVKLPSTLTLYTDEELDLIEDELSNAPRTVHDIPIVDQNSGERVEEIYLEDDEDVTDIDIITYDDTDLEAEFDGEYLPLYTPKTLPPYSLFDPTKPSPKLSLVIEAETPDDDPPAYSDVVDTPQEDALAEVDADGAIQDIHYTARVTDALENESVEEAETEVCSTSRLTLPCGFGSRLQKLKQKLTLAFSPKKTVARIRDFKKNPRQK